MFSKPISKREWEKDRCRGVLASSVAWAGNPACLNLPQRVAGVMREGGDVKDASAVPGSE